MTESNEYKLVSVESVKDDIRASYHFEYLQHTFDMILELMEKHGDTHTWMNVTEVRFNGDLVHELKNIIKYRHPEEFNTLETAVRVRCEEKKSKTQEKQADD